MAQFTRLAAAIAAASLAGAVHAGDVEVNFSGEVDFAFEYHDNDNTNSSSEAYLDTAELGVEATDGTTTAGVVFEYGGSGNAQGDDDDNVDIDNAFLEYKINNNYTVFAEYDDTIIGLQGESMMWNDSLHKDGIYDFADTMTGVKIKGGPISSTIYVAQGRSGDDDLQEFGTSVDYTADMFTAHFGYVSDAVESVGSPVGAFSLGGTATINNITLIAEYVMLSDDVNDEDPTFLQLEANYEMKGYTLGAAYFTSDEAEAINGTEDRIALSVAKDITDMLWVQAELDFESSYADVDDNSLWLVAGASF
jgi:hypothetical protein